MQALRILSKHGEDLKKFYYDGKEDLGKQKDIKYNDVLKSLCEQEETQRHDAYKQYKKEKSLMRNL